MMDNLKQTVISLIEDSNHHRYQIFAHSTKWSTYLSRVLGVSKASVCETLIEIVDDEFFSTTCTPGYLFKDPDDMTIRVIAKIVYSDIKGTFRLKVSRNEGDKVVEEFYDLTDTQYATKHFDF